MRIQDLIMEKNIEHTSNLVDNETLLEIENKLGISFGKQLKEYILNYGYLAYKHIEFYGINSIQKADSDMVKQTEYLHKYYSDTKDLVALGNSGDGKYLLASSEDIVFEYYSEGNQMNDTGKLLYEYIIETFNAIK